MRQSIRALGWAITISTLILFAFLVTAAYSVFQTVLMEQGIGFGGFRSSFSNNTLILSMPIVVNNTGYYDITDFNITTILKDVNGTTLIANSTFIREIKRGSSEIRSHNLSISFIDILSKMNDLLFNDTEFKIELSIGFRYAYALALNLQVMNVSMPWGAPFSGFTVRDVSISGFNGTHLTLSVSLDLENHSFFDVAGNVHVKIYNEAGGYIGSGRGILNVPSNSRFSGPVETVIEIENPANYTGRGYVEVYFEFPAYNYTSPKLGEISYG